MRNVQFSINAIDNTKIPSTSSLARTSPSKRKGTPQRAVPRGYKDMEPGIVLSLSPFNGFVIRSIPYTRGYVKTEIVNDSDTSSSGTTQKIKKAAKKTLRPKRSA